MKINLWIRTTSAEDTSPTMRIDYKMENRDTPVIQRYGRRLVAALGYEDANGGDTVKVIEANGDIINALYDAAEKAVADGELAQVFLDAAKIVEAYTIEHGDRRTAEKGDAK